VAHAHFVRVRKCERPLDARLREVLADCVQLAAGVARRLLGGEDQAVEDGKSHGGLRCRRAARCGQARQMPGCAHARMAADSQAIATTSGPPMAGVVNPRSRPLTRRATNGNWEISRPAWLASLTDTHRVRPKRRRRKMRIGARTSS